MPFTQTEKYNSVGTGFDVHLDDADGWEKTLRGEKYFDDAMAVFLEMQREGGIRRGRKKGIRIEELLAGNEAWMMPGISRQGN